MKQSLTSSFAVASIVLKQQGAWSESAAQHLLMCDTVLDVLTKCSIIGNSILLRARARDSTIHMHIQRHVSVRVPLELRSSWRIFSVDCKNAALRLPSTWTPSASSSAPMVQPSTAPLPTLATTSAPMMTLMTSAPVMTVATSVPTVSAPAAATHTNFQYSAPRDQPISPAPVSSKLTNYYQNVSLFIAVVNDLSGADLRLILAALFSIKLNQATGCAYQ